MSPEREPIPAFSETTCQMIDLAEAAGQLPLRYWRADADLQTEQKNPQDIVTRADNETETFITEQLQIKFPEDEVLGEEKGSSGNRGARRKWIIDPVDGTSNFVNGSPDFAVLLAAEEDGVVVSGVIHFPATGETFVAERGTGAFRNGAPLRGATHKSDIGSMYGNTHMSSKDPARTENMKKYMRLMDINQEPHARNILVLNACIARGLCDVADGIADFHFREGLNWWDYAAGVLLAEEAGAVATDVQGNPLTASSKSALIAGPETHKALLELFHA